MKFPRYESYRDSGVEWIGEIPSDWDLFPIRAIFHERQERNIGPKTDFILSVMKDRGVIPYDEKGNVGNKKSEDIQNYKVVYPGDLVINKMNAIIGSLGISDYHGALSQVYIILFPKDHARNDHRYLGYLFKVKPFQTSLIKIGKGIMVLRESIEFDEFKKLPLPLPTLKEQDRIANFLDQKTAEIDEAIDKKQRLIELLKEQKAILINQAVTKGLNPDVPMRDSGVEWIGEVPAHWELTRLKHSIGLLPGFAFKSEQYSSDDSDIPLLRGINVNPGFLKWDEVVYWPKDKVKHVRKYLLAPGDYVIGMDRPWISSGIRASEVLEKDLPCLLLQRVARIRAIKGLTSRYLGLVLRSDAFLSYFEPMLSGISVPHISPEQIGNFLTVFPPKEEQDAICAFVSDVEKKHNELIENEEALILKLTEYKSALISNVVTGKIKI